LGKTKWSFSCSRRRRKKRNERRKGVTVVMCITHWELSEGRRTKAWTGDAMTRRRLCHTSKPSQRKKRRRKGGKDRVG